MYLNKHFGLPSKKYIDIVTQTLKVKIELTSISLPTLPLALPHPIIFTFHIPHSTTGSTADKTVEICVNALKFHGLDVMMHLTCTNITQESLFEALNTCKKHGIRNILALRGDPPANAKDGEWKAIEGGFKYAVDLVRFIKKEFGDYFCVAVAGYPEGHLECTSLEDDLKYLVQKVEAGAELIVTQLFYDNEEFKKFVLKCRELGIPESVHILPGIMPIQSYAGFTKMTGFCKTKVPPHIMEELELIKDDDAKVKDYGVKLAVQMSQDLLDFGVKGLHFYTLNLETAVLRIVEQMGLYDDWISQRSLPWRPTLNKENNRSADELVRPIFWANRPTSYIKRTAAWDEFPNGRFGNRSSPAYGEVEQNFMSYSKAPEAQSGVPLADGARAGAGPGGEKKPLDPAAEKLMADRRAMWGQQCTSTKDVNGIFIKFLKNDIKRLPWCPESPAKETNFIHKQLIKLNQLGAWTINSQPRVNGALSTDPYVGWGPTNGYVYQKAYIEFFCSPELIDVLVKRMKEEKLDKHWAFCAYKFKGSEGENPNGASTGSGPGEKQIAGAGASSGNLSELGSSGKFGTFSPAVRTSAKDGCITNTDPKAITAITWGVFPGSEILQPTVCDNVSFKAWKAEAFSLWNEWACLYEADSESRNFVEGVRDSYYLVNIVDNDLLGGDLFTNLVSLLV